MGCSVALVAPPAVGRSHVLSTVFVVGSAVTEEESCVLCHRPCGGVNHGSDVDLYALDLLREWDVSVDEAVSLHRLNVRVAVRSGSPGIVQEDVLLEDVRHMAEPSDTATSVQFVAKAIYPTECEGKVALSVYCNKSKAVAKDQSVGQFWKLFNFQCEPGVVVRNVLLEWDFIPDANNGHVEGTPKVVLDTDTGLQVRGVDVLPTLRCLHSSAVENWISRGHSRTENHAQCRLGSLLGAPVCHTSRIWHWSSWPTVSRVRNFWTSSSMATTWNVSVASK